ncbi:hypothetical protein DNHGIG_00170 [Collibacillus ludicampi]|jgi:hypothetical protein|uniref:DUF2187 domain-containing protein n=1 Tax=Collibacillus ludicampi TaxID=2771369 RepID=A0AAV4L9P8_9BACL|nr:hypothetical protein DNHGIG_00170 [Collibacillus ludicampi]
MIKISDCVVVVSDNFFSNMIGRVVEINESKVLVNFDEMDCSILFDLDDVRKFR